MNKKGKALVSIITIFFIFLIVASFSVKANNFNIVNSNVKSYNEQTKTVTIKNAFGLGEDLATAKLETPHINAVPIGKNVKVAEITIDSFSDYINAFGAIEFQNIKDKNKTISKQYRYLIKGNSSYESPIEKGVFIKNDTWTELTKNELKKGKVTLGIFTDVNEGDYVEWIPSLMGINIKEWAIYIATFDTGLVSSDTSATESALTGFKIIANQNITILNFSVHNNNDATRCFIMTTVPSGYLYNGTMSGKLCSFPFGLANLTKGSSYYVVVDKNGANFARVFQGSGYTRANNSMWAVQCGQYSSGAGNCHIDYAFSIQNITAYNETADSATMTVINSFPANNSNTTSSSVTFGCNVTATGTNNITSVRLNGAGAASWVQNITGLNTQSYNATFTNTTLIDGNYTWNCNAVGTTVNATSSTWNFIKDATKPVINIVYPININYSSNISTINFTASDTNLAYCWYSTNNGVTNSSINTCTTNFTNVAMTQGMNNWTVYANDTFGNYNSSNISFYASTIPTLTFISQIPSDITSVNVVVVGVNITYNVSSLSNLNLSSILLYYKSNSTTRDTITFINGSSVNGWHNTNYTQNITNNTYVFKLYDNDVYPATYNVEDSVTDNNIHTVNNLGNINNYIAMEFLNVTNTTQYNFFEIMSNASIAQSIYYCNSSYAFAADAVPNPTTSPKCTIANTIPAGQNYNHSHSIYSAHQVVPIVINTNTGTIGTVKVTPTSYLMLRGGAPGGVNYYTVPNVSRTGAMKLTTNGGVSYTNQTFTVDAHLHQFSGTSSLYYYLCANNTDAWSNTCSATRQDLFDLAGLAPTIANVYSPTNGIYKGNIAINYTNGESPNGYEVFYNITLLNSIGTYNSTITTNNSNNKSYLFNSNLVLDGNYIINVTTRDSNGLQSSGYSENFTIDNTKPLVNLVYPQNITYNYVITSLNFTASDTNLAYCWYSTNNGVTNITTSCNSNITGLTANQGSNTWLIANNDSAGNINMSIKTFYVDSIAPNLSIVFPSSSYYNYAPTTLNYTYSTDATCMYSTDGGTTNITQAACGNITGLTANQGSNTWLVQANDSLNNKVLDIKTFIVDTLVPTINFTSPTINNGSNVNITTAEVNVSANDTNIQYITINIYSNTSTLLYSTTQSTSPYYVLFTGLNAGTYYLNSTVVDFANNANSTETRTFIINATPTIQPQISIPTSGGGGGNILGQILGSISTDFNTQWLKNTPEIITIKTFDVYNKPIDVSNITIKALNNISYTVGNIVKSGAGTYKASVTILNTTNNVTIQVNAADKYSTKIRQFTVFVEEGTYLEQFTTTASTTLSKATSNVVNVLSTYWLQIAIGLIVIFIGIAIMSYSAFVRAIENKNRGA